MSTPAQNAAAIQLHDISLRKLVENQGGQQTPNVQCLQLCIYHRLDSQTAT